MKKINPEEMKMMNEKPTITPQMLEAPNGTEKILLNAGITIVRRLKEPVLAFEKVAGMTMQKQITEADQELPQVALKWERWPIPESYVDKALDDLRLALKNQLRKNGLMR